jgi:hypothetical protein
MLRSEAVKKMEKILPMVSCSNEGEAMAAALRLRFLSRTHGIDLERVRPSYNTQPAKVLCERTRYLWAVADGIIKPKRPNPVRAVPLKKTSDLNAWKFNFHVNPGPDYVWVAQHTRRSSKGTAYTVRGFWRLLPGRLGESRKAA